ncbi:MAG: Hsp70 family protein, partial [Planctomycetota bacterium]
MAISQNSTGGPSHHVGIDLGTTNCAVSYLPTDSAGPVRALEIPQVVRPGEVAGRPLLPSFTYLAGEGEFPAGALDLPWAAGRDFSVGEFARQQGGLVPTRLVSSAKSWLSHAAVDRRAAILPWRSPEESRRISPVEASARYLGHL